MKDLLQIRVKARGPLNETSGRLYVSLDELMTASEASTDAVMAPELSDTSTQPTTPLW